jgi:hypothetical protein
MLPSRKRGEIAARRTEEERAEALFPSANDDDGGGFHARLRERLTN